MTGKWKEVQADFYEFMRDGKRPPYFQWSIQDPMPEDPMEKLRRDLDSENELNPATGSKRKDHD